MTFRVRFSEQGGSFRARFGEVQAVDTGAYERGYAEGYVNAQREERDVVEAIVDRTITAVPQHITNIGSRAFNLCTRLVEANAPEVRSVGANAFEDCTALVTVNMPKITTMGNAVFQDCTALKYVSIPRLTTIPAYAFSACRALTDLDTPEITGVSQYGLYRCSSLTELNFDKVTGVGNYSFRECTSLVRVDLPSLENIFTQVFYGCSKLEQVILRNKDVVCTLANANSFAGTLIEKGTGYIYVPQNLIDAYRESANWSTYAAQFRAIEDYPDIAIPREYTEVMYLQSDGKSWIETDYIPKIETELSVTNFKLVKNVTTYNEFIGSRQADNSNDSFAFRQYGTRSAIDYQRRGNVGRVQIENKTSAGHVLMNSSGISVDGAFYSMTSVENGIWPLFFFACNLAGAAWRFSSCQLGQITIKENGVLLHKFIPCIDANQVACMYDVVEMKTHYNMGTGTLIAGDAVG